jgi:hypothetical protein
MNLTFSDLLLLVATIGGFGMTAFTVATYVQKVIDRLDRIGEGLNELEKEVENHESRIKQLEGAKATTC